LAPHTQPFKPNSPATFKDTLLNTQTTKKHNRTIIINPKPNENLIWSDASLVAEVIDLNTLNSLVSICNNMGLVGNMIRYLGALDILISFSKKKVAYHFRVHEKEKWQTHFKSMITWNEDYTPKDRLTWLIIRGVPPHLCRFDTFDLIGKNYGRLVQESSSSLSEGFLNFDHIGILTLQLTKIQDSIAIRWRN